MTFAWTQILLYIYGLLLIFGGVMGFIKAKSVPSLVAGVVCGVIEILMGIRYQWHDAPVVALIIALILLFMMGRRYLNTRKAMPALLIVVLSLVVAIVQLYVIFAVGLGSEPFL